LHLLQHALGGFALAQAQLAAGWGEFGEAAVEQAFDALALGLIQARIEDMPAGWRASARGLQYCAGHGQ
jgi:hypothetical protein